MRHCLACLACAALIAAARLGHAGAYEAPARPGGAPPPPHSDHRLPDHVIKSPGFPSALAGKCRNAQDCAAYCERHPATAGCRKRRKAAR